MVLRAESLSFAALQRRLIEDVRRRLHNGEFTERGLARQLGVSQPHIHNVLKGHRVLTPEIGDALLAGLGLDLLELLTDGEIGVALEARDAREWGWRPVGLLAGVLGPGHVYPETGKYREWVRMPGRELREARRPVLVELGTDPETPWAAGYALVETDERCRARPHPDSWCALRYLGAGFCRRVRLAQDRLLIRGQRSFQAPGIPDEIDLAGGSLLATVRGIVLWCGPDPRARGGLA
jgi:hypothetical protein